MAQSIPGTVVSSKITTGNTNNTFPVMDTMEALGTAKQTADTNAMYGIPTARRTVGMECYVASSNLVFRLVGGIDNSNWTVVQAGVAAGSNVVLTISGATSTVYSTTDTNVVGILATNAAKFALPNAVTNNDSRVTAITNLIAGNTTVTGSSTNGASIYVAANGIFGSFVTAQLFNGNLIGSVQGDVNGRLFGTADYANFGSNNLTIGADVFHSPSLSLGRFGGPSGTFLLNSSGNFLSGSPWEAPYFISDTTGYFGNGGNLTNLNPTALQQAGAALGNALLWNGTIWTPGPVSGGGGAGGIVTNSIIAKTDQYQTNLIQALAGGGLQQSNANGGTMMLGGDISASNKITAGGVISGNGVGLSNMSILSLSALAAPAPNGYMMGWVGGAPSWTINATYLTGGFSGSFTGLFTGGFNVTSNSNPSVPLADIQAAHFIGAFVGDGSGLTNIIHQYNTNAVTALTLGFGNAYYTNLTSNITLANFSGITANAYESLVVFVSVPAGSDHSVTFPAGVRGPPGSGTPPVLWCTNGMLTKLIADHYARQYTNCAKQDYAP